MFVLRLSKERRFEFRYHPPNITQQVIMIKKPTKIFNNNFIFLFIEKSIFKIVKITKETLNTEKVSKVSLMTLTYKILLL